MSSDRWLANALYHLTGRVRFQRVERFVFVCAGICRSPFAEGFAQLHGEPAICGGAAIDEPRPMDPKVVDAALRHNVDLRDKWTQPLHDLDLTPADLLVAMDWRHGYRTWRVARRAGAQSTLLGYYALPRSLAMPDPYGGTTQDYEIAFEQIRIATSRLIAQRLDATGELSTGS